MTSSLMADPAAVLEFGELTLIGPASDGAYSIAALGEDWTFGNGEVVATIVDSLLGDGQLASVARHNNREAKIGVEISASDGQALARAETALIAETEKPNTLTWHAPDGFAPTTVFDVVTSWAEHMFSDEDELRLVRRYVLTLQLYPHPRSATSTTVSASGSGVAPGGAPVEVVVTNADTAAGWFSDTGATVVDGGDFVSVGEAANGWTNLTFDAGSNTDYSATPLLVIDWWSTQQFPFEAIVAGVSPSGIGAPSNPPVAASFASPLGAPWIRTVFDASAYVGVPVGRFGFSVSSPDGPHAGEDLHITRIAFSDGNAAYSGTARQLFRSIEVGGSARAMGTIDIRHEDPLGDCLVWSGPDGSATPLRAYRTSGAVVSPAPGLVSGATEDIGAATFVAEVPAARMREGAYMLMARLNAASEGPRTITITAQTKIGGVAVGQLLTATAHIDITAPLRIHALTTFHLPPTATTSPSAIIEVTIEADDAADMDEGWLCNVTDGDLTLVTDAGPILQLTSPTVTDQRRRVWTGAADDALHDAGAQTEFRGQHLFEPGHWSAFTVTTGPEDAAVTVTYDKRWHSNAGEDG